MVSPRATSCAEREGWITLRRLPVGCVGASVVVLVTRQRLPV